MSLNKTFQIGNLTRDPEQRMTPSGQSIAKFGLAVNRTFTGQDGQKKEEVLFIDVDAFGKQAELVCKYLKKGSKVMVEGRLKLDTWEKDGEKKSRIGIVLENVEFLDSKGGEAGGQTEEPRRPARPAPAPRNDADDDLPPF